MIGYKTLRDLEKNKKIMIERKEYLINLASSNPGLHLNLGCSNSVIPNFINIDKYIQSPDILNYDILDLPYGENTVDSLYCSHVLEHLSIRKSKIALKKLYGILKPGCLLFVAVPDLEVIMECLLSSCYDDYEKEWYLHCMYGYQIEQNIRDKSLEHPDYPPEFHLCGYTKDILSKEMIKIGYNIKKIFSYNGWDTPSIWVEATK